MSWQMITYILCLAYFQSQSDVHGEKQQALSLFSPKRWTKRLLPSTRSGHYRAVLLRHSVLVNFNSGIYLYSMQRIIISLYPKLIQKLPSHRLFHITECGNEKYTAMTDTQFKTDDIKCEPSITFNVVTDLSNLVSCFWEPPTVTLVPTTLRPHLNFRTQSQVWSVHPHRKLSWLAFSINESC